MLLYKKLLLMTFGTTLVFTDNSLRTLLSATKPLADAHTVTQCKLHTVHIKAYTGIGSIAPLILSLGTRCRGAINFISPSLYTRERIPVPIKQEAVWSFRRRQKSLTLIVFEPRTVHLFTYKNFYIYLSNIMDQ